MRGIGDDPSGSRVLRRRDHSRRCQAAGACRLNAGHSAPSLPRPPEGLPRDAQGWWRPLSGERHQPGR